MEKQALVVGLGQFGLSLAEALIQEGVDVLGVDLDPSVVQAASAAQIEAVSFDATLEEELARAVPTERDLCVCAIGGDSRENAIIVTALLRQMGAPHVLARANDELMERILQLVGAHEIINPEREIGKRLAMRLAYRDLVDQVSLGSDLVITEVRPPAGVVDRTLKELQLPNRFGIHLVATRRSAEGQGRVQLPDPTDPIREDDLLVVVGGTERVRRFLEEG